MCNSEIIAGLKQPFSAVAALAKPLAVTYLFESETASILFVKFFNL